MINKTIWAFVFYLFTSSVFCHPKEVIIIRHADMLVQPQPGPTLSPKGLVRAMAFAIYYINTYKTVDFIFASDPIDAHSTREIETIAPLANLLALNTQQDYPIAHPFASGDYAKLTNQLLNDPQYKDKRILICWDHGRISAMAAALGVHTFIPPWPGEDYDTVYDIKYTKNTAMLSIFRNQYPVTEEITWETLYRRAINTGINKL